LLTAIAVLSGVGLIAGIGLGVASKVFYVYVDPKIEAINEILPQANCGACGYTGCSDYARSIVEGEVDISLCPPGGSDTVEKVAAIMGVEAVAVEPITAMVMCAGGSDDCSDLAEYHGPYDCTYAHLVGDGPKACKYGCLGYSSCQKVCDYDAINITETGLAWIDEEKCIGCKKCVNTCPRNLIKMVPKGRKMHVLCSNHYSPKEIKKICKVGCTGCGVCSKKFKDACIKIDDFLAVIDYQNQVELVDQAQACPVESIIDLERYQLASWVNDHQAKDEYKAFKKEQKAKKKAAKAEAAKKAKEAKEAKEAAEAKETKEVKEVKVPKET